MSIYDNDVLGVGNSLHPANQEENEIELTREEQMEEEIMELESKIKLMTNAVTYRKAVNAKLIELMKAAAGENTFIINKLDELL